MDTHGLPKAEKAIYDFKIYYAIIGAWTLVLFIASLIQGESFAESLIFIIVPVGICSLCFLWCLVRHIIATGRRRKIYENGTKLIGKVIRKERRRFIKNGEYSHYFVISYTWNGEKKIWKSPAYDVDDSNLLYTGSSCYIYVYKNKVCIPQEQIKNSSEPVSKNHKGKWKSKKKK